MKSLKRDRILLIIQQIIIMLAFLGTLACIPLFFFTMSFVYTAYFFINIGIMALVFPKPKRKDKAEV